MENNNTNGGRNNYPDWESVILPIALIAGLVAFLVLGLGEELIEPEIDNPIEPILRMVASYTASIVEALAIVVIVIGVTRSIVIFVVQNFKSFKSRNEFIKGIQLGLGRTLALGLEFLIAGDILRTAVAPTQHQILRLGAIVLLRTLMNYFLEHEIHQVEADSRLSDISDT
jgi:uncharacterized membrane protein